MLGAAHNDVVANARVVCAENPKATAAGSIYLAVCEGMNQTMLNKRVVRLCISLINT
jgi:hypothetical protein